MNCRELEERLHELLDGGVLAPEPAEVRAHRESCASCRELFAAARRLERGLRAMPAPAVPAGFTERAAGRVLLGPRGYGARSLSPRWWLAAAAALLLAGLGFWGAWQLRVGDRPGAGPLVEKAPPPSLRQELAEASDATLRLTRSLVRDAADHAGILVPTADRLPAPDLPPRIETSVAPLREAGRTVATGLEPVTHSARRAWDMMVRDLPINDLTTP